MRSRTIRVDALARVEGEGALTIRTRGREVSEVQLRIYEPPRFFEALLRGRHATEAPDITARICGICPVAYQMSAVHAVEEAFGVGVSAPIRELRRLLYCGEWIESHALHVFLLHAPDFLGYDSAVHMAREHGDVVRVGLEMKKIGNAVVRAIGGREIHPVSVRVGGFHRAPTRREMAALAAPLERAREIALETVRWTARLPFPEFERDYEFVALRHPGEYPLNEGRLVSSGGLDIAIDAYEERFEERHVPHSNALHSVIRGRGPYLVGPLARYALNFDRLPQVAQEAARGVGLPPLVRNPFQSIVVRSVELVFACDEALRIVRAYEPPDPPAVDAPPRAGIGRGCTEAPRGILYHRYRTGPGGAIEDARIIPPTAQNQPTIEEDLRLFVPDRLDQPPEDLRWQCEQAIRNHDPCISCATHFLRLEVASG